MISLAVNFEMINRLAVDFALDPAAMVVYFGEIVPIGDIPAYTGA